MGLSLYNLDDDVAESRNLAAEKPEIVELLLREVDQARSELGDSLIQAKGIGVRQAGEF